MISEYNIRKIKRPAFSCLFALILLSGCDRAESFKKVQFSGEAQGTYYAVTYYDSAGADYHSSVDSLLQDFDQTASLWVGSSLINRVNNNEEVLVNEHFKELYWISREVSEATYGYFDITVGSLVSAWGFGVNNQPSIQPGTVDSLLPLVNYRNVRIEEERVIKTDPRIKIDFNAVAQGYSVDLIARFLESKGIQNYLVDIGGEVYAHGTKPGEKPWKVGIEKPADDPSSPRELIAKVPLSDMAVATSGNYRKYYIKDGIRYAHTINPFTGYPVRHTLLSVTVVAGRCAYADAYATALLVMGMEEALTFIKEKQPVLEAFFIYSGRNGDYETFMTEGLRSSLEKVK